MDGTNTAEIFDLQRERQHRVRQATGGSGPPADFSGNWLSEMEEGSRFFARGKSSYGSELDDYIVSVQFKDVAMLCKNVKGRDVIFEWHDTQIFSNQNKFYLTIRVKENDNQQIHPGELDRHVEPQGEHILPEE